MESKWNYLTYEDANARFPGAMTALAHDYSYTHKVDPEGFEHQFEVKTVKELLETVIDFYTRDDDRLAFREPNLGTNVESSWFSERFGALHWMPEEGEWKC